MEESAMRRSPTCFTWPTLGAFAIGTEGFHDRGLLPALARDLDVGMPAAGHRVTAFSLAYSTRRAGAVDRAAAAGAVRRHLHAHGQRICHRLGRTPAQ